MSMCPSSWAPGSDRTTTPTLPEAATVIDEWRNHVAELSNALCSVVAYQESVHALREQLAVIRASAVLDERVDGKNEVQRAAQTSELLATDPRYLDYQQLNSELVTAARELGLAEAKVTALEARISLDRHTLGYLTAVAGSEVRP